MAAKKMLKEESFEEIMKKLDALVEKMENEKLSLDDSIALTKEGLELINIGSKKLEDVKQRVKVLTQGPDGELMEENMPPMDDGNE